MNPIRSIIIIAAIVLAACDGSVAPVTNAAPPITPQLRVVAGDGQTDTVMRTLPIVLTAALTNRATGNPLAGRIVNWVVVTGGGQVAVPVTQTDAAGIARQPWTLGSSAGGQKLIAVWLDPETGEVVTLDTAHATAARAAATTLQLRSSDTTTFLGARLDLSQVVTGAYDPYGNAAAERPTAIVEGWAATADTAWAVEEGTGRAIFTLERAVDTLALTALLDLRTLAWSASHRCGADLNMFKDVPGRRLRADSTEEAIVVTAVRYTGTGRYDLDVSRTHTTWWDDGSSETRTDAPTFVGEQRPDTLRWFGYPPATRTVGRTYVGASPCSEQTTGRRDPFVVAGEARP